MFFNIDKCKVMHLGHKKLNAEYLLGGEVLDSVDAEQDLGVISQNDCKSFHSNALKL